MIYDGNYNPITSVFFLFELKIPIKYSFGNLVYISVTVILECPNSF